MKRWLAHVMAIMMALVICVQSGMTARAMVTGTGELDGDILIDGDTAHNGTYKVTAGQSLELTGCSLLIHGDICTA